MEPALASPTGPHLEKCSGVGAGGQEPQVLETGSEASSLPDHTVSPPGTSPGIREKEGIVDATYLEFEEFQ